MGQLENQIDSRRNYYAKNIVPQEFARSMEKDRLINQRVLEKEKHDLAELEMQKKRKEDMLKDFQSVLNQQSKEKKASEFTSLSNRLNEIENFRKVNDKVH